MSNTMTFPDTFEEFAEQYKIVDKKQVYTNGVEFIPIFRVEQWLEHQSNQATKRIGEPLTDEEIIKALKCCSEHKAIRCRECPLYSECDKDEIELYALDLINRLQAKNEGLEVSLQAMRSAANGFKSAYERERGSRITAIQEFAEMLKQTLVINNEENTEIFDYDYTLETIDNLVKEMIGEQE